MRAVTLASMLAVAVIAVCVVSWVVLSSWYGGDRAVVAKVDPVGIEPVPKDAAIKGERTDGLSTTTDTEGKSQPVVGEELPDSIITEARIRYDDGVDAVGLLASTLDEERRTDTGGKVSFHLARRARMEIETDRYVARVELDPGELVDIVLPVVRTVTVEVGGECVDGYVEATGSNSAGNVAIVVPLDHSGTVKVPVPVGEVSVRAICGDHREGIERISSKETRVAVVIKDPRLVSGELVDAVDGAAVRGVCVGAERVATDLHGKFSGLRVGLDGVVTCYGDTTIGSGVVDVESYLRVTMFEGPGKRMLVERMLEDMRRGR